LHAYEYAFAGNGDNHAKGAKAGLEGEAEQFAAANDQIVLAVNAWQSTHGSGRLHAINSVTASVAAHASTPT
jgi:hypothetical protein